MKLIFPMAGRGSRFLEKANQNPEYKKPKPIINVLGKPMIKWAVESFSNVDYSNIIFIVHEDHVKDYEIDKVLKETFSDEIKIAIQTTPPEGAVKTVLLADKFMEDDDDFISVDSDAIFEGDKYLKKIKEVDPECAVPVFNANEPKFSFAKVDEKMRIIKTAEKEIISNWAIHGAYYFKSWGKFKKFANEKISKGEKDGKPEYYIAPLMNKYIEEGRPTIAVPCRLYSMGTPEQLDEFLKSYEENQVIIDK